MRYLITTVPGLEDFVVEELAERFQLRRAQAHYMTGRVAADVEAEPWQLRSLRTAERFGIYLGGGEVERLDEVVEIARQALKNAAGYLAGFATAGVRCERAGSHPFDSRDVAREVGRLLKEAGAVISLADPDVEVNVDVVETHVVVWITTAKRSLRERPWRVYQHHASLNPIIAQAMLRLARPQPGETICDLTCGGGTIAIEGALTYPHSRFLCVDVKLEHVLGAAANARAAGIRHRIDFLWFDSTRLHRLLRPLCHKYVMNPPYGLRLPARVGKLYSLLAATMRRLAVGDPTYVVITPRHRAVEGLGDLRIKRMIYQGGLYSYILAGTLKQR